MTKTIDDHFRRGMDASANIAEHFPFSPAVGKAIAAKIRAAAKEAVLQALTDDAQALGLYDDQPAQAGGHAAAASMEPTKPFQQRVQPWLLECFGEMIAGDREERNHRFLEEALELVQACDCTASEAHQLVDYVFGRPVGEPTQEVGGVMVTLAALCLANDLDMHAAGETELARISDPATTAKIRAKQAAKPKHSPLPQLKPVVDEDSLDAAARVLAECMDYPWEPMPDQGRQAMRRHAERVIDAAMAVGWKR